MVAIKAHQAQSFLNPPGPKFPRCCSTAPTPAWSPSARRSSPRCWPRAKPAGEIIRIDDADLDSDPDRLAVELQTMPMFGGRKIVRATAGRRINAAALQPLLEGGTLAAALIVEAGNLKPDRRACARCSRSRRRPRPSPAMATRRPTSRPSSATCSRPHGLSITPDARELLVARLGADRAMSRGEIEKLALYAAGKPDDRRRRRRSDRRRRLRAGHRPHPQCGRLRRRSARGRRVRPRGCLRRKCADDHLRAAALTFIGCIASAPTSMRAARSTTPSASCARPCTSSRRTPSGCSAGCGRRRGLPRPSRAPTQAAKAARLDASLEETITEELLIALAGAARPAAGRA